MENDFFYQVAGHCFRLSFSNDYFGKEGLNNYAPFLVSQRQGEGYLFHLSVVDDLPNEDGYNLVGQFDNDTSSIGVFKSDSGAFRFRIALPGRTSFCTMDTDAAFRKAQVTLPSEDRFRFFGLNNCMMLLFAFSTANLDTLMMHASVIKNGADGFMFLGKSGTGKSTHSRLWLEYIKGSELLNDDNPVVRIVDGRAMVYGTPWSGKIPCYRNEEVLLKGIVKLQQAPRNQIKTLSLIQAYAIIFPACSGMRWEKGIASGIHQTVEKLICLVPSYRLECLPDKGAADLSASTIKE